MIDVGKEALLAFELFQRSPRATQQRNILNQQLVKVAMYEDEKIHTTEEIRKAIIALLRNQIALSHDQCRKALDNCIVSGDIKKSGDDNYALTKQAKKRLKQAYELMQQAEKHFDKELSEYVGRRLSTVINPFAEALLCKTVKEVIQSIFYRNSMKLRKVVEGKLDLACILESDVDAEKELRGRLETFTSIQSDATDATTEASIEGIKWFMANLDDLQKHFIASMHHRVFYFQILNVDPRLQRIEDACCKSLRIYLDTNVLVRYLCEGSSFHEPIVDVVNMSKKLGIKISISSKTLQESERLVKSARGFSTHLEDSKIGVALLASSIAVNNPIIETFLVKRRDNPELKWSGYVSRFTDLEIFLVTEDIEVSDDDLGDITMDESFPIVRKAVKDAKGVLASPEIIDHDSYNIVLIQKLRKKYPATMLGSSVWLLTIDNKLPKADRILRKNYPQPHCKTIDQWGGILLPFQNIGKFIATDEYIAYLVSQQLGIVFPEEVLEIQFFKELEKSDIDIEGMLKLDPEIALQSLIDLQKDREARTLLGQIQTTPEEEKEPIVKAFYERALSIISKHKDEEEQRDKREITRLQKGIKNFADELCELESTRVKDRDRMKLVRQKLKETQGELDNYRRMPFWERVKFIFRGPN